MEQAILDAIWEVTDIERENMAVMPSVHGGYVVFFVYRDPVLRQVAVEGPQDAMIKVKEIYAAIDERHYEELMR